jgi:hypothetical protein
LLYDLWPHLIPQGYVVGRLKVIFCGFDMVPFADHEAYFIIGALNIGEQKTHLFDLHV